MNKIKKEEEMYKKAIEINPNYVRAYSRLGRNYISQGMIEKAEDMIKKSIEIDPNHDFSYQQLRRIYNRQGISYSEQLNPAPSHITYQFTKSGGLLKTKPKG